MKKGRYEIRPKLKERTVPDHENNIKRIQTKKAKVSRCVQYPQGTPWHMSMDGMGGREILQIKLVVQLSKDSTEIGIKKERGRRKTGESSTYQRLRRSTTGGKGRKKREDTLKISEEWREERMKNFRWKGENQNMTEIPSVIHR